MSWKSTNLTNLFIISCKSFRIKQTQQSSLTALPANISVSVHCKSHWHQGDSVAREICSSEVNYSFPYFPSHVPRRVSNAMKRELPGLHYLRHPLFSWYLVEPGPLLPTPRRFGMKIDCSSDSYLNRNQIIWFRDTDYTIQMSWKQNYTCTIVTVR